jgi:hypothetical protein
MRASEAAEGAGLESAASQPEWETFAQDLTSVDSFSPPGDDGVTWRSPSDEVGSSRPVDTAASGAIRWASPSDPGASPPDKFSQEAFERIRELALLQNEFDRIDRDSASPFVHVRDAVDMRAYERSGVMHNRPGDHPRDRHSFWGELLERHPEYFSDRNRAFITGKLGENTGWVPKEDDQWTEGTRWAPEVDDQWLKFHEGQGAFIGDKLVHHHWDRGPWAVPLPEQCHRIFSEVLHYGR